MRRFFALAQAAWLALLIAEPASLHACAMHASGHGGHAAAVAAAASDDAGSSHGGHHDHQAAIEHATIAPAAEPETDQGADSACQCLGECCAATATTLSAGVSLVVARVVRVAIHTPSTRTRVASRAADLRLPFANAPPVALTA
jgi:hypothetical protein